MRCQCNLFANDTLFSVAHNFNTSMSDVKKDLKLINNWAFQWKMSLNPDPSKQAQEIIFSRKKMKGALSGLRQFLPTESPLKMMKNTFCFTSKTPFIVKIFKFLS